MQDEDWQDEDDWDDDETQERPNRRWPILAALGVVLVFTASAWYALWNAGGVSLQGGPPLIRADTSPVKEKPTDPGGLQIPYQDKLVYERLLPPAEEQEPEKQAQVATPPEKPAKRPEPATPASPPAASDSETADKPAEGERQVADAATPATAPASDETPTTVPSAEDAAKAETQTDSTTGASAETETSMSTAEPTQVPQDAVAPVTDSPTTNGAASDSMDSNGPTDDQASSDAPSSDGTASGGSASSNVPVPPAAKPDAPDEPKSEPLNDVARVLANRGTPQTAPAPAESGYRIQLAATRDEASARTAWNLIQGRNSDVLGELRLVLKRVNITGRGIYYRVQAGPFSGADEADAACQKLRANNQDCLLVRP